MVEVVLEEVVLREVLKVSVLYEGQVGGLEDSDIHGCYSGRRLACVTSRVTIGGERGRVGRYVRMRGWGFMSAFQEGGMD